MEKQNKSDFPLALKVLDKDGNVINYDSIDFTIRYFTKDGVYWSCSCTDGVYSNCEILDGVIYTYVNGFDWQYVGKIYCEYHFKIPNVKYSDGIENVKHKMTTSYSII